MARRKMRGLSKSRSFEDIPNKKGFSVYAESHKSNYPEKMSGNPPPNVEIH
jgi:hypothetical protein